MKQASDSNIKFETALDRLEEIVGRLQDGNLPLDESLKIFEEGIELIRICQEKLDSAESKVSVLIKDSSGNMGEVPFSPQSEE